MRLKKMISAVLSLVLCTSLLPQLPAAATGRMEAEAAVVEFKSIGVDINDATDNRTNVRSELFADWSLANGGEEAPSFTVDGLTFTLRGSELGGGTKLVFADANRNLVRTDGKSPVLSMDGARLKNSFDNSAMTLEISGLAAGTHTIATWNNIFYTGTVYGDHMTVSINGEVVEEDLQLSRNSNSKELYEDDDSTIFFHSFEAKEGEPVEITFSSEDGTPVLCAFEVDGVDPKHSIKNPSPADGDTHFLLENGLSWEAADGAVEHRLFIGTDYTSVASHLDDDPTCVRLKETTFSYDQIIEKVNIKPMQTYYWRVDEIFADNSWVRGKVMSFEIAHLAFPTAEGYGRYARPGRGGRVIEVTTLEDGYEKDAQGNDTDVPIKGSLRYALEYEKGARVVIFKVGGVIQLQKQLLIPSDGGNVYVAGQTAPGDGITLTRWDFGTMGTQDVVIRDIRVRVGDWNGTIDADGDGVPDNRGTGGMGVAGSNNVIVDHCTISWATDEGFSSRNAKGITFQWNIIGETLSNSIHYEASASGSAADRDPTKTERHSYAASISGDKGSFHHNLLINNAGRNWSMAGGVGADNKTYGGQIDIRNNVVYNYRDRTTDGGARRVNFVNNYYKMGASSQEMPIFTIDGNELSNPDDHQMAYLSGNQYVDFFGQTLLSPEENAFETVYAKAGIKGPTPQEECISKEPFFESFVNTDTAEEAYQKVIDPVKGAGANKPAYDYIDSRYIKEVTTNQSTYKGSKDGWAGIIDSQADLVNGTPLTDDGYPNETNFKGGEAPADTDRDGIPDDWETAHGLDPNEWIDGSSISLSDEGYTNLELYLNELAGDPIKISDNPKVQWRPDPANKPAAEGGTGEVDENDGVSATDALAVLRFAAKLAEPTAEEAAAADTNQDGQITAADALYILQYAAKLIPSLPVSQ